jgi:hypothetical protein
MRQRLIWILLAVIFLILAIVFVFIFREPIRDYVVAPLVRFYWHVQRIWRSQEPDVIWGAFLMGMILVMMVTFPPVQRFLDSTLFKNAERTRDPLRRYTDPAHAAQRGRLDFWVSEVEQIYLSRAANRFVVIELKKLILDQIAFREHFPTRQQAEWWLDENPERVPEAVWLLFHPEPQTSPRIKGGRLRKLKAWLRSLVIPPPEQVPVATARNIDAIIGYLEKPAEAFLEEPVDLKMRNAR